ncbi:MAG: EamA family transporter [Anaeromicrobium sp.]|jgi:hypothetical protein|uniref:EamA family transporter n=1 Tax=Anaeromicrobium sp. TaxID=1929132 RepID=UPI0025D6E5E5|nr:EamA family transporter [Anaeromicrobium sp.]MCT4593033.1 EamA family transporter [Anaeromicrobium sp.]
MAMKLLANSMTNMVLGSAIVSLMGLFMHTVKIKNKMKSYYLMLPAVILSAGVIVTGKISVAELGPFTILFFRFFIASIILIPVVINMVQAVQ